MGAETRKRRAQTEEIDAVRSCRVCGYSLVGLAGSGACPECGAAFPPFASGGVRHRSAADMCILFGWPLAGVAIGLFLWWGASWSPATPTRSTGLMVSGVSCIVVLLNTPAQLARLAKQHADPGERSGDPLAHLSAPGAFAVALVALVPFMVALIFLMPLLAGGLMWLLR